MTSPTRSPRYQQFLNCLRAARLEAVLTQEQVGHRLKRPDGEARSFHVTNVNSKTLRPILVENASRKSYLMTDDSVVYPKIGEEYSGHGTVNHSAKEYVRGDFWYTNTVESYFALLKRGVYGTFHSLSEAHLHRYLAEFDFRHNTRAMSDAERGDELLRGAKGKRLMYHQPREAGHA